MTVAKSIVQLVMTILAAVVPMLAEGPLDTAGWINVVILGAGVVTVWNSANIPGWEWAKFVASAVSAIAVVLSASLTGGISSAEVIQMILAGAAAVGVGAVPNGTRAAHAA